MSDIIDRMARAAYERNRSTIPEDKRPPAWEDETDHLREHWRANQRAGLAAAREPDEAMMEAGGSAKVRVDLGHGRWEDRPLGRGAVRGWQAMIDEVLKS